MFIIGDSNEAIPCECRQVRISEDILRKSGISEEFRKKRLVILSIILILKLLMLIRRGICIVGILMR